jgi:hypothetical protein
MAFEDWTTYTEVDPGATITVAAQQITCNPIERDRDTYVYNDKGAGHFGNFVHYIDVKENGGTSDLNSVMMCWGLNNTVNDFFPSGGGNEALCVMVKKLAGNIEIRLQDRGNSNEDSNVGLATNTRYYLKIERTGLTALSCKIYTDAAHLNLVDTLTIVCQNTTYRYVYGVNTYNTATDLDFNGWTYNLDLQEVGVETHTPSDTAKTTDEVTFSVKDVVTDTAKASDDISFFKGLKFGIIDTAKASDSVTTKVSLALVDTAKSSDIISFIKHAKYAISDTAKASDTIGFVWAGMGGVFKYPIKMFKDTLHKYTKNHSNLQKYSSEKNSGQKYRRE